MVVDRGGNAACRLFIAVMCVTLWGGVAARAQGPMMPGPPSPGPSVPRPSAPRPSVPRPTPGRNSYQPPSSNRFNSNANRPGQPGYRPGQPNYRPGQPGQSGYQPGQPGYQPGAPSAYGNRYAQPTNRPFTTFAPPRPQVPMPGQSYAPRIHAAPMQPIQGTPWQQAQRRAQSGQFKSAQQIIDQQLRGGRSLNGLMNAVSVMEQAGAPPSVLTPYRKQAYDLARQDARQGVNNPMPWVAIAKFSLEDQDDVAFNQATDTLIQRFPYNEYSHYFCGMRAIKNEDWKTAEAELKKAQDLGLPNDAVAEWLKLVIDRQKIIWDFAYYTVYLIVAWVVGMVLLYFAGKVLSAMTLRSVRNGYTDRITPGQRRLRTAYRLVVGVAGFYYYLSLPMILLLSIALPLSIGYGLLMVPALNLYLVALVLVVGIGGFITALSGIRACFVRSQPIDDQAARLTREENPELWQFVGDVADKVGTRPVDEIVLVPGAEAGVYELGGYLRKLRDKGRRVLVLGAAALDGLSTGGLRSILAHEYGHFLNRDTAGGRMALQVNLAIDNFVVALMMRRKIRWWDLGIHFLRFYYVLYARLTFGASRLQELHSDFVAVAAYGPTPFRDGLSHAIRRSVEFDSQLDRAFGETVAKGAAPLQYYGQPAGVDADDFEEVEAAIGALLNEASSERDSHPSPSERFAILEKSGIADPDRVHNDDRTAWELLPRHGALLAPINTRIRESLEERATLFKRENGMVLEQLNLLLKLDSSAAVFRFERAIVHYRLKKHDDALKDLSRLIEDHRNTIPADPYLLLTAIHRDQRDYRLAVKALRVVIDEMKVRDVGTYCSLAVCYMRLGQHRAAAHAYGRALEMDARLLPALLGRGRAHQELQMKEEAARDFEEAKRYYPYFVGPYGQQSAMTSEDAPSSATSA